MKILTTLIAVLTFSLLVCGQKGAARKFDVEDFNKKLEVAKRLFEYDRVAWKTTDVLLRHDPKELEKLGAEWFCFLDKTGDWHAVYGKYENEKYNLLFHFKLDKNSVITKTDEKIDAEFLDTHARALATARSRMDTVLKGVDAPRFNQFIFQNEEKSFDVWLLPAFQTNGVAVYGAEFIYKIDKTGAKITKDESYFQGKFRGFKTDSPREIWLDYGELEKPTQGAVFFAWYYKPYFTTIYIDNSKSTSAQTTNKDNTYLWLHMEKDAKSKNKK